MKVEVKSKKGLRTILSVIVDKKNIQIKMDERLRELLWPFRITKLKVSKLNSVSETIIKIILVW